MGFRWLPLLLLLACPPLRLSAAESAGEDPAQFFERRVRPLLVANCDSCHGADKQESDLRLDSRDAILQGGVSGAAAVPGSPADSLLFAAVSHQGDLKMPPAGRLLDSEVAILKHWIAIGLPWPKESSSAADLRRQTIERHWAFQPLQRPPIPTHPAELAHNPLDAFVLAELNRRKLPLSPRAEPAVRLRRLSFDLRGLPPSAEQVSAFREDSAPDAWERQVDRMLADPALGERWARHWLDVARYADNKGYVFFEEKSFPWAYTYRDYVIESFNRDLPFDRFVREQLAADQFEPQDKRAWRALGFLTLGGHFMNNTHDIMDDRIDVVTRGLLGLTVSCARCHDHKYDPISQADYYALYGVFRSCYEPTVPPEFDPPPDTDEYRKFVEEMAAREKKLVDFVTARHRDLVNSARARAADYLLAVHARRGQPAADDFMLIADPGDLNPTMILRWQVYLEDPQRKNEPLWRPWLAAQELPAASFGEQFSGLVASSLQKPANGRILAAIQQQPPTTLEELARIYGQCLAAVDESWQKLRDSTPPGETPPERLPDEDDEQLRGVLYGPAAPPDVSLALDWGFLSLFPDRPTQGEYQKLLKEVETWSMTGAGAPPRAMVLFDSPRPFEPQIFVRGNPHRLGETVPRRFLHILNPDQRPFTLGSGRRELALAMVHPANMLTPRVIVNRLWLHHFGEGLARTPSDFGLRSEPPSHPELLDWLACELRSGGRDTEPDASPAPAAWSLKRLHRLLLTSATYQQSSHLHDEASAKDPENRWLSRMNRRRLEFEALRDALLSAAGMLDLRQGGPPVQLWDALVPRRSIYGFIDRLDLPTLLATFDFPAPASTSPQRGSTTVPPQALFMMNHSLLSELAGRTLQQPDVQAAASVPQRVSILYARILSRSPEPWEQQQAAAYLGDTPSEEAWQRYVHALLMTNEFAFVD